MRNVLIYFCCGFLIVSGLLLTIVSPLFLLFVALGIGTGICYRNMQTTARTPENKPQSELNEIKVVPKKRTIFPVEQENASKVFKFFKTELEENDEYFQAKKEIIEDYFDGDKIYKYEPFELEYKIEERKVYAMADEWIYIGRLKKTDEITDEKLYLYPNIYKIVHGDNVETENDEHYFGFY